MWFLSTLRRSSLVPLLDMFFFFNDTATTEIYTLSLHDALPISPTWRWRWPPAKTAPASTCLPPAVCSSASSSTRRAAGTRSEEHTSELQSPCNLVCRLLLEKKKKKSRDKSKYRDDRNAISITLS